jgi:hypothetical protein
MSYYPTLEEIDRLGFTQVADEAGEPMLYLDKTSTVTGRAGTVELVKDEGHAVLVEWLGALPTTPAIDNLHGWTTCTCYEHLEHACNTAFDVIAEGR